MKTHLIQFTLNGIAPITEANVLLEIHALVSRVTASDEICRNPYLGKIPRITWFKPKSIQ